MMEVMVDIELLEEEAHLPHRRSSLLAYRGSLCFASESAKVLDIED